MTASGFSGRWTCAVRNLSAARCCDSKICRTLDSTRLSLHPLFCSILTSDCVCWILARERYNLNAISHDSAIGLIRMVIARGYNVTEVRAPFLNGATPRGEFALRGAAPYLWL